MSAVQRRPSLEAVRHVGYWHGRPRKDVRFVIPNRIEIVSSADSVSAIELA
jgi:hypothetical protein